MKKQEETTPAPNKGGRPATGKKSTKPNITLHIDLQKRARAAAELRGLGYSEFIALAVNNEIAKTRK
jgi:hypothetical protein